MDNTSIYKKIVVKVGTNVLTKADGTLDRSVLKNIVSQIAEMKKNGIKVILVSSGAVGAGKTKYQAPEEFNDTQKRQIYAAIGQAELINNYQKLFGKHDILCAQVLATREDFRDRLHYLNIRDTLRTLRQENVIPIVNENDVISMTEAMFTDNDQLASTLASMMDFDAVFFLSSVDGLYTKHPDEPDAELIQKVDPLDDDISCYISPIKSEGGRGGMKSKCDMAVKLASLGIASHFMNGKSKNIMLRIVNGEKLGTTFLPQKKVSDVKKWIAVAVGKEAGEVVINPGAVEVIFNKEKAASLLPVGITSIEGEFDRGEMIRIVNEAGEVIGRGVAQYGAEKAKSYIGKKGKKPLIHYNYLYLHSNN